MPSQFNHNPLNQFESENLPVGWPWRFFSVSLIIFLAATLFFFGLSLGYEPYLNSKIREMDANIDQLLGIISREDQEKFAQFYSQLANLKTILDDHILSSKIFPLLEKITNQKVYYNNLNLRVPERELELEGFADSYGVLGEQLEAFDQAPEIERYLMNQSQANGNLVQFKATLKFKSDFLK